VLLENAGSLCFLVVMKYQRNVLIKEVKKQGGTGDGVHDTRVARVLCFVNKEKSGSNFFYR